MKLHTATSAGRLVGVSSMTIGRWIKEGTLKAQKTGHWTYAILEDDVINEARRRRKGVFRRKTTSDPWVA